MIDTAQTVLLLALSILTILILILGVQIFFILRELRSTIEKTNKILDDAGTITESVSGPISTLSSVAAGVKTGAFIANLLKRKKKKEQEEDEQ